MRWIGATGHAGAVYGTSDTIGAYPTADPMPPADLAATIYSRFGPDPAAEIHDPTGLPFRLTEGSCSASFSGAKREAHPPRPKACRKSQPASRLSQGVATLLPERFLDPALRDRLP
jgi:Protein of unknown function (DUF1501)